ncbi:MAG: pseudaminic acid cytidylyltransferase [Prevotellaceae bacterium]|jgi:N-acylneuraminate cytidylyltransferase|nr:pseudaminic acid cytidylyltransferase [Prevotellaceae bacterium]
MKNLAIIPARGGSKRIPRKNIKSFSGKPIIAYSIDVALKSELFDEIMVSTDDIEIAETAKKYGAKVPFLRSPETSDDFAGTSDVIVEVLQEYKKKGTEFEIACCIYPAAPFITIETLQKAYNILTENSFDSVFPVCAFSYPIQRALKIENRKTLMINPENLNKRSQDLIKTYHDAGQFYWFNVEKFLQKKIIMTDNCGSIVLNELQVQDIDNETDWKLAELKYKLIKQ